MDAGQPGDCILSNLLRMLEQANKPEKENVRVPVKDYQTWRDNFLFETLQYGTRYGQSFCNKFDITDYILYYMLSVENADRHIRKHYVR